MPSQFWNRINVNISADYSRFSSSKYHNSNTHTSAILRVHNVPPSWPYKFFSGTKTVENLRSFPSIKWNYCIEILYPCFFPLPFPLKEKTLFPARSTSKKQRNLRESSRKCTHTHTRTNNHWKRPWCWERLKAKGEEGSRGLDDWIVSSIQWTWVWANSSR